MAALGEQYYAYGDHLLGLAYGVSEKKNGKLKVCVDY